VAYNAGTWPSGSRSGNGWTAQPGTNLTGNGAFSGYTAGADKGSNAKSTYTNNTSNFIPKYQGWRVLSKSGSGETGVVTLIHAGVPCNGYEVSGQSSAFVTALNNFCKANFVNTKWASSARSVSGNSKSSGDTKILSDNGMLKTGTTNGSHDSAYYWLAVINGNECVYSINSSGYIGWSDNDALGVRPVVTLKPAVMTTGNKISYLGQSCWELME